MMTTEKLGPGLSAELEVEVIEDLTVNPTERPGAEVLSTPSLLGLMERCSIKAVHPFLSEGSTTVGYAVDGLRHLAPTAIGGTVLVRSVLNNVDGNKLTFSIEAFEGDKKIGVATHRRAIIPRDTDG
jgi:predicted thioesterase